MARNAVFPFPGRMIAPRHTIARHQYIDEHAWATARPTSQAHGSYGQSRRTPSGTGGRLYTRKPRPPARKEILWRVFLMNAQG